jgi:hypothetical protein
MISFQTGARLECGLAWIIRGACEALVVGLALQVVRRILALVDVPSRAIACRGKKVIMQQAEAPVSTVGVRSPMTPMRGSTRHI